MLVNMTELVKAASREQRIVPGFNVFGYEDALAVIQAAEGFKAPVILMSNSDAVDHMDPAYSAPLFKSLAERSSVPVVIHLDHAKTFELILHSMDAGYTSVMYDGSALPVEQNIVNTAEVVKMARQRGVSVEAELGSVPYMDRNKEVKSVLTEPLDAGIFVEKTSVDALAVAIGSLHRMQTKEAKLDFRRLKEIEKSTDAPLVIHGTSGIVDGDVKTLLPSHVAKMNIGTALRMAFGNELKGEVLSKPHEFDRVKLLKKPMEAVKSAAEEKYRLLGWKEMV